MDEQHGAGSDRRVEGRVRELENRVHTLELSDNGNKIEIATIKGEINGLRSSSATSTELKSASELLNVRLDHLHKDLSAIKSILWLFIGLIVTGFVGAVANMVYSR